MKSDPKWRTLWQEVDPGRDIDVDTELFLEHYARSPELQTRHEPPAAYEQNLLKSLHSKIALNSRAQEHLLSTNSTFFSFGAWFKSPQFSWGLAGAFAFLFVFSVTVLPQLKSTQSEIMANTGTPQLQNKSEAQIVAQVVAEADRDSVKSWLQSQGRAETLESVRDDEALNKAFEDVAREMGHNL